MFVVLTENIGRGRTHKIRSTIQQCSLWGHHGFKIEVEIIVYTVFFSSISYVRRIFCVPRRSWVFRYLYGFSHAGCATILLVPYRLTFIIFLIYLFENLVISGVLVHHYIIYIYGCDVRVSFRGYRKCSQPTFSLRP